jgi:hypothetical protein
MQRLALRRCMPRERPGGAGEYGDHGNCASDGHAAVIL